MRMMKLSLLSLAVAASTLSHATFAAEDFGNLFSQGKVGIDARYRYEHVDQDNALDNAEAQTLRTRLTLQSGKWYGLSALVEVDNVARLGDAAYNDSRNGQTDHSLVADPDGSEINQALLRYDQQMGSAVLGRQRINLDNQRFVGGVAWRQNEQTYDAALAQLRPLEGLSLTYAYLDNINSIFGPDDGRFANRSNPADIEGHSHLLNVQYVVRPELTVTAYHYLLGLDNLALTGAGPLGTLSSRTSGVRLSGALAGVSYALEYARQSDYADNPQELDSDYWLAELGYTVRGVLLKAGYEVLGGDAGPGNRAFQTPLATKHAFQGWADQFLTTPADGVRDAYFGASTALLGGTLQAWYHDFRADQGSSQYGEELDLAYGRAIPGIKGLTGLVKYARYDADDFAIDTDKLWLQLQYTY
jgi:hypothetical protein